MSDILDPRGRADRKGLIMTAAVLVGAQAGLAGASYLTNFTLTGGMALTIEGVLLWLGLVAVSKRLHDLGCGLKCLGWGLLATMSLSIAVAFTAMLLFGEDVLLPGAPGYLAVAAAVFAPVIVLTIWLHCAKGDAGTNRFGPPPDETGFSGPEHRLSGRISQVSAAIN
jgi:uncharacterized membrane protein YhaH (DUF805 family)